MSKIGTRFIEGLDKDLYLYLGQSNFVGATPSFGLDAPITGELDLRVKQIGRYGGDLDNFPTQLGVGNCATNGSDNSRINSSYTLAKRCAAETDNDVYILPIASGGTGITTGDWRAGGVLFEEVMSETAYFVSKGYFLKGIFWGVGESDLSLANVYDSLLASIASAIRTIAKNSGQNKTDEIPFVTFQMTPEGIGTNTSRLLLQQKLTNIGSMLPYSQGADFSNLPVSLSQDPTHYDARQQIEIGNRLYDALVAARTNSLSLPAFSGEIVVSNQTIAQLGAPGFQGIAVGNNPTQNLYTRLGDLWKYRNSRGVYRYKMEWELTTGEVHNIVWEQDRIPTMTGVSSVSASVISKTDGCIFGDNTGLGGLSGFTGLYLTHDTWSLLKLASNPVLSQNFCMVLQVGETNGGASTPIGKLKDGTPINAVRTTLYAVME